MALRAGLARLPQPVRPQAGDAGIKGAGRGAARAIVAALLLLIALLLLLLLLLLQEAPLQCAWHSMHSLPLPCAWYSRHSHPPPPRSPLPSCTDTRPMPTIPIPIATAAAAASAAAAVAAAAGVPAIPFARGKALGRTDDCAVPWPARLLPLLLLMMLQRRLHWVMPLAVAVLP